MAGTTLDLDVVKQTELFDVARTAWAAAGKPDPHLATSFWFAFGAADEARAQVHRHLRRYMNWIPAEYVDAMAPTTGWAGSEDELFAVLRKFAAIGTDEVHLIPTSSDIEQLRRAADVAAALPVNRPPLRCLAGRLLRCLALAQGCQQLPVRADKVDGVAARSWASTARVQCDLRVLPGDRDDAGLGGQLCMGMPSSSLPACDMHSAHHERVLSDGERAQHLKAHRGADEPRRCQIDGRPHMFESEPLRHRGPQRPVVHAQHQRNVGSVVARA